MPSPATNRRIAVIGCGYVGSALGEAFVQAGHDVVGTTTTAERVEELHRLGIKAEVAEVTDVERLHAILVDRDAVYLAIAPRRQRLDYREVYLAGARNLLAAAKGTTVRRIIYTSSTRVYGQNDGSWVDESSPTEPLDENGRILLEAERVLLGQEPHGLSRCTSGADRGQTVYTTVLRLSGIYGPGRDPAARVQTLAGTERTDGDVYVNMVHLDDITAALMALLDVPHHGVLNLSDDEPTMRREFYDRVLAEAELPPIRWVRGDPSAPEPKLGKRVRNDLIKKTLNFVLKHPTH